MTRYISVESKLHIDWAKQVLSTATVIDYIAANNMSDQSQMSEAELLHQLGRHIRIERTLQGLTQTELAQAVGVGLDTINRIENGSDKVAIGTIVRIAEKLSCSVASLFGKHINEAMLEESSQAVLILNLKSLMRAKGINPVELASRAEIELSTVKNYLLGNRKPSPENLKKIAQVFDVPITDLWKEPSEKSKDLKDEPNKSKSTEEVLLEVIKTLIESKK